QDAPQRKGQQDRQLQQESPARLQPRLVEKHPQFARTHSRKISFRLTPLTSTDMGWSDSAILTISSMLELASSDRARPSACAASTPGISSGLRGTSRSKSN